MTREQASAILAERGLEFVEITNGDPCKRQVLTVAVVRSTWRTRNARSLTPYTVATGPTWQEAYGNALTREGVQ